MDAEKNVVLGKWSFLPSVVVMMSHHLKRLWLNLLRHLLSLGLSQPLLDIYDSPVYRTSLERMQGFFTTLYDNW